MGDIITQQLTRAEEARADAVVGILAEWAHWQHGYRIRLGYSPKSAGFQSGGSAHESSESDYSAIDQARFEIVDTCVDELPPDQRSAIHHCYLSAVYRMRDYAGSLAKALETLQREFVRKGAMW